jgi:tetratricopeptide (TPR) repeat protein
LRTHPPLPLAELFAIDRNALSYDEGTKSGPFYATSWLLVHKLLVKSGLKRLVGADEFNRLLSTGNDPQQALAKAFQVDIAALDADLKQTGRQFAFSAMQVDFEAAWGAQTTSTTQPSPAEVQAYLGDLLYRSQRETEAEDWFNKAVALDPRLPLPYEGLGWLRLRQSRRAEAVEYFKQANQYGSKNALSHYHHAEMLLQELNKDAENASLADLARSELETVVQLRPNFAAAHYSLAHLSLMLGRGFEEGIPHAEVAIRLEPGKPQYQLTLVGLLFYSKKLTEARAALEPLLTADSEDGYKASAESLRDMIEESISRKRSLEDLVKER